MGRLDNGRNNRNSRDSFSNERTGRRSGAYRKSRTDSSKSKKRKLEKEEVLTKKQIREVEKDGDPLWMREPDQVSKTGSPSDSYFEIRWQRFGNVAVDFWYCWGLGVKYRLYDCVFLFKPRVAFAVGGY